MRAGYPPRSGETSGGAAVRARTARLRPSLFRLTAVTCWNDFVYMTVLFASVRGTLTPWARKAEAAAHDGRDHRADRSRSSAHHAMAGPARRPAPLPRRAGTRSRAGGHLEYPG